VWVSAETYYWDWCSADVPVIAPQDQSSNGHRLMEWTRGFLNLVCGGGRRAVVISVPCFFGPAFIPYPASCSLKR
jgi:hypothetical protein